MATTTILDAFPNKNMRSVCDDALFDMSMYLAPVRGHPFVVVA